MAQGRKRRPAAIDDQLQVPPSLGEKGRTRVHARGMEILQSREIRRGRHSKAFPSIAAYPREFWLNGELWKLSFHRYLEEQGDPCFGLCDSDEKTIQIRLRQGRRHTFETFVHELIHAMEDAYGFEVSHPIVYILERAVADYLLDNWALWRVRPKI